MALTQLDMLKQRVGVGESFILNPVTGTVATTATRLLTADAGRYKVDFFNPSNFQVLLLPDDTVSATKGILLDSSGGWIEASVEEDGEIVLKEWWGIALGSSAAIIVVSSFLLGSP